MIFRPRLRAITFASLLLLSLLSSCAFPQIGFLGGKKAAPKDSPTAGSKASATSGSAATDQPAAPTSPSSITELTPADFASGAESKGLHDVIVFTSLAVRPFPGLEVGAASLPYPERHLWALSVDRAYAGRISPAGFGGALLAPAKAGGKPRLVEYGFSAGNSDIETIAPPAECSRPASQAFDANDPPCGGFQIAPNGHYLFYASGANSCGRKLTVQDLTSNQPVRSFEGARWAYWLKDSTMMVAFGSCDTPAKAGLYIPQKDSYAGTGNDGNALWNADHTEVLFQVSMSPAVRSAIWGFNINTSKVFMWQADETVMEDTPTWTPEADIFLFQHRKVRYDKTANIFVLEGPLQILQMSAKTRAQKQVAYSGGYDYHLCYQDGKPCDQWYGDWIKVTRVPFIQAKIKLDPATGQPEDTAQARCALAGQDCESRGEEFALNWKTGELVEWDKASLPAEAESAYPKGKPNLDSDPVYSDPAGGFTFRIGMDGKSLWYVPAEGDPVLWVEDGEDFVYVK